MGKIAAYIICIVSIILGVKGSIQSTVAQKSCKHALDRMLYYFSILVTFLIIIINLDRVMGYIMIFTSKFITENINGTLVNIISLLVLFFSIQFIIFRILKKIFSLIFKFSEDEEVKFKIKKSTLFASIGIGVIKSLIVLLIVFIGIITFNNTFGSLANISLFNDIKVYSKLNEFLTNEKDEYVYNSIINNNQRILVYYNGVTLEEGIKSTDEINNKAKELVQYANSDREKAKKLYYWIGANIEYDMNKAIVALKENSTIESGAITAWKDRKGICFDYACLYVAMARVANLKVRLVTGQAYDGEKYGSHAWNQVYLADEKKWIDVDTTFYLAGDYFDSDNFYDNHVFEGIAGEW